MSSINFDAVHTAAKQQTLGKMMLMSAAASHNIENTNEKLTQCPICADNNITFYTEKFGYNMDRCGVCSQVFCNPMPCQAQLESYYNGPMKKFENQFFNESFEQRIPIFSYRIEVMKKYLSAGDLLDIGSAIGIFIEALKRADSLVSINCCEPSLDACEKLKHRFPNVNLFNCWLQDMPTNKKYDAITLWDTLEHIVELDLFCEKIFSLLKPGGYWFFSTPNLDSFEWEVAGRSHVQLLPPGHVNLFNGLNIGTLLEKFGFDLVEYQTPNGSLDVSYIEKLTAGNQEYDLNLGRFFLDNITRPGFGDGFAKMLVTAKKAGNMLVIARRPPTTTNRHINE
jgi:2-polyprenyl-3-methyl-5-hydroxy-6-metoxy-1,4-benzoquinol methylase